MFGECEDDSHALECAEIRARAASYKEALATKDKRRLDFLDVTGTKYVYAVAGVWFFRPSEDATPTRMPRVRDAIDAALAPQGEAK